MDPLKPFTSAIRSLWLETNKRTEGNQRAGDTSPRADQNGEPAVGAAQPVQTLHSRLRARMATLARWDATRARQLFVECVLMSELGEHLASDPAFVELVQRVSQQIESDAKLSMRLDALLKRVAQGELVA